jgi:lipopolysaccharide assembly protein A
MAMADHDGRSAPGDETLPSAPGAVELEVPRTRTSSVWVAAAVGAFLVLLMLVFILQNGDAVQMHFLWIDFSLPLGVGLLLAGVLGALIVVALGIGRMLQLRLAARRHRKADRRAAAVSGMGSHAPG